MAYKCGRARNREMVGYVNRSAPVDECFHQAARNGSVMSRVGVVDRLLVRRKYESLALGPDPPAAVSKSVKHASAIFRFGDF